MIFKIFKGYGSNELWYNSGLIQLLLFVFADTILRSISDRITSVNRERAISFHVDSGGSVKCVRPRWLSKLLGITSPLRPIKNINGTKGFKSCIGYWLSSRKVQISKNIAILVMFGFLANSFDGQTRHIPDDIVEVNEVVKIGDLKDSSMNKTRPWTKINMKEFGPLLQLQNLRGDRQAFNQVYIDKESKKYKPAAVCRDDETLGAGLVFKIYTGIFGKYGNIQIIHNISTSPYGELASWMNSKDTQGMYMSFWKLNSSALPEEQRNFTAILGCRHGPQEITNNTIMDSCATMLSNGKEYRISSCFSSMFSGILNRQITASSIGFNLNEETSESEAMRLLAAVMTPNDGIREISAIDVMALVHRVVMVDDGKGKISKSCKTKNITVLKWQLDVAIFIAFFLIATDILWFFGLGFLLKGKTKDKCLRDVSNETGLISIMAQELETNCEGYNTELSKGLRFGKVESTQSENENQARIGLLQGNGKSSIFDQYC